MTSDVRGLGDTRAMTKLLKSIVTLSVFSMLTGCAAGQIKKEWIETRGLTQAETDEIMAKSQEGYVSRIIRANQASNAVNTAPKQEEERKLKTVWCNFWKRLKNKCKEKPEGLSKDDRDLWLKANAIEMAYTMAELNGKIPGLETSNRTVFDGDECAQ